MQGWNSMIGYFENRWVFLSLFKEVMILWIWVPIGVKSVCKPSPLFNNSSPFLASNMSHLTRIFENSWDLGIGRCMTALWLGESGLGGKSKARRLERPYLHPKLVTGSLYHASSFSLFILSHFLSLCLPTKNNKKEENTILKIL